MQTFLFEPLWLDEIVSAFTLIFILREYHTFRNRLHLKYFLTPLVTVCVVAAVVLSFYYYGVNRYSLLIFASLISALIADTLLMIVEADLLKYGIVFFLIGHFMYIGAFSTGYQPALWHLIPAAVLAAAGVFAFSKFKGNTRGLDTAVMVYIASITVMVFLALTGSYQSGSAKAFAAAGAVLFMFSDLILAVNAFLRPINKSTVYTWLLYGPAQMLIALSCF